MDMAKALEISRQHEDAMEETPKEIVKLIFDKFPYGISIAQLNIILEETKELLDSAPLTRYCYPTEICGE